MRIMWDKLLACTQKLEVTVSSGVAVTVVILLSV